MKYLKEGPFLDRKGEQVVVPTTDPIDCTTGWMLTFVAATYRPTQAYAMQQADVRRYNRVLDVLEAGPADGCCFAFEDADFDVLKRVVNAMAPLNLLPQVFRNSPELEDLLAGAVDSLPASCDGR